MFVLFFSSFTNSHSTEISEKCGNVKSSVYSELKHEILIIDLSHKEWYKSLKTKSVFINQIWSSEREKIRLARRRNLNFYMIWEQISLWNFLFNLICISIIPRVIWVATVAMVNNDKYLALIRLISVYVKNLKMISKIQTVKIEKVRLWMQK